MTLTVRPLCTDDYPQWRPLWDGYTHFMSATLTSPLPRPQDRALADSSFLFCRVVEKDGRVIGFAMCVLHEGTRQPRPFAIWKICLLTLPNVAQGRVKRLSTP